MSMAAREALRVDAVSAFAVFARHLNFTRAAAELHIAQPSLHAKVAKLGQTLGVTLYEKVGRELRLTADGLSLAAFAADQDRAVDDFLAQFGQPATTLRVAAGRAAIRHVLDRPLRAVAEAGVELQITPADRSAALELVETGVADIAVVGFDPPPRHLCSRPVDEVPQLLVAHRSHPAVSGGSVRLSDLDGLELVVTPAHKPHRQSLERALAAAGVDWVVASEADGWDLIVHLVSLGVGAAVVNGCVPIPEPLVGVVVEDLPAVGYWLAWREERQAIVEVLVDFATQAAED